MKNTLHNRTPAKRDDRGAAHAPLSFHCFETLYTLYIRKVHQTSLSISNEPSGIDEQKIIQELFE